MRGSGAGGCCITLERDEFCPEEPEWDTWNGCTRDVLPSPPEASAASPRGIPSSLLFPEHVSFLLLICAMSWDCVPPGCCSHHPRKCSIPGWSLWHRSDSSAMPSATIPLSQVLSSSLLLSHTSAIPCLPPVPTPVPLLCHPIHSPACLTHWEFFQYIFKPLYLSKS